METLPNEMIMEIDKYLCWMSKRCLAGVNKELSKMIKPDINNELIKYLPRNYNSDTQGETGNPFGKEVMHGGIVKNYNGILMSRIAHGRFLVLTLKKYRLSHVYGPLINLCDSTTFMYICKCGVVLQGSKITVNKHLESMRHIQYILANEYNSRIVKLKFDYDENMYKLKKYYI